MKKVLNITKNIVTWILVVTAISVMVFTVVSVSTFDRNDRNIFGYKMFIVMSDSMKATDFKAGDLVVSKAVDPSTLREGDIITFQSVDPESYGEIITHKIRSLTTDAEGNPGFVTYGTTTNTNDATVVTYSFVIGKYSFSIPDVGTFFRFLKTTPGYIICVLLPFLLLIMARGANTIRLFRRYKREQQEELDAERAKLEADRKRNEDMLAELLAMKAQLQGQLAAEKPAEESPEAAKEEGTTEA